MRAPILNLRVLRGPPFLVCTLYEVLVNIVSYYNDYTIISIKLSLVCY